MSNWFEDLIGTGDDTAADPSADFTVPADTAGFASDAMAGYGDVLGGDNTGALTSMLGTMFGGEPASMPDSPMADGAEGISNTAGYADRQGVGESLGGGSGGALSKIMQGLGIAGKDGAVDYSDPHVLSNIMKVVMTGGSLLNSLNNGNKPKNYKSPAELRAELQGPYNNWTPAQAASANSYFSSQAPASRTQRPAASMPSPIVPGQRYAEGGDVEPDDNNPSFHSAGALSLVHGPGGGQDDLVSARLGPGEYVMDADTVASVGDGSNEHGANVLDKWREELRKHKRSAPPTKIPPKAKAPGHYLAKAKGAK